MNRREAVQKFILGGTFLVIVPSALENCTKNTTTDNMPSTSPPGTIVIDLSLAENLSLNTTGSSKIVQNIIVINLGTGFIALSSICTHQGCTVGYNPTAGDLECPCHGSVYNLSGNVLVGPAPSPLRSFTVSQTGTVLTITL
jgi:cytochrome b6-f complex iron-sulfur subunit